MLYYITLYNIMILYVYIYILSYYIICYYATQVNMISYCKGYGFLFTIYIFFFVVGVLNIVTSLFVEQATYI